MFEAYLVLTFTVNPGNPIPQYHSVQIYSEGQETLTREWGKGILMLDGLWATGHSYENAKENLFKIINQMEDWHWVLSHINEI